MVSETGRPSPSSSDTDLSLVLHRRAEIALHHIAEIVEVLLVQRLIEAEAGLDVGLDCGGQLALGRNRGCRAPRAS